MSATTLARSLRDWHDEVRRRQSEGDLDGAIELLRRLSDAAPHVVRLRHDLVTLLRRANRPLEADQLAVEVDPSDSNAWARLSRHARQTRDIELFIEVSLGWVAKAPHNSSADHFAGIARALHRGDAHERCSDEYIRELFDQYADSFDDHLGALRYRGPQIVAGLVHDLMVDGDLRADASIADLGCGTGLVGHQLRLGDPVSGGGPIWHGRLVGNDLSRQMLDRTGDRVVGDQLVYDEVAEADFVSFLDDRPAAFDAVIAADSFIYVGDLRPVFRAALTSLRPGGWLIATAEHADDGSAAERGYLPDLTGRYRHDAGWLETELTAAGFDLVVVEESSVRHECGRPVPGVVALAHRPA